ncbi:MAG TPA: SDR family oxidoreductase [Candidatus Elarobacter sp.]|jgi:NAD(P)-dependent dehydrogenase (short-subunit alcohol dehydrogenase family)|nr:SDR family oxidoreductase [Candidatus Elarobacter sp.]
MASARRIVPFALGAAAAAAGAALLARRAHVRDRERLRDRVVVITGGSRGLGFALAEDLARGGARVTIAGRDADTVERARARFAAEGLAVDGVRCDVRDRADADALIAHVEEHAGPVDVLINVAGVIEVGSVWDQSLDDFRESVETHVFGPLHTMYAVLPGMRARGGGQIVNVSSIGGLVGVPHLAPYSAGKFALTGLTQAFAAEVAHDGITVTLVCPGLMRTGSPDHAIFKGNNRAEYAWFAISDSNPLISSSTRHAVVRIVHAIAHRRTFVTITPIARLAPIVNALAPRTTNGVLALAARLLPPPAGDSVTRRDGESSHSPLAPSVLTFLDRLAKRRNNEE